MNRFGYRTAIAVCLATLFLFLPLFSFVRAAVIRSGPTSVLNDSAAVGYYVSDSSIIPESDNGFFYNKGNYVTGRTGGFASFYWLRSFTVYIISSSGFTVELGDAVYLLNPFTYCILKLIHTDTRVGAIVNGKFISCDSFSVISTAHTTVSTEFHSIELYTEQGSPIELSDYKCILYSVDDTARLNNGKLYVTSVGKLNAFMLDNCGLIVYADIFNSPYTQLDIKAEYPSCRVPVDYDGYVIKYADSTVTLDGNGNITFGDAGQYIIDFTFGNYVSRVTFTIYRTNTDINDSSNGGNEPDDDMPIPPVDEDQPNNGNQGNGSNDDIVDNGANDSDDGDNTNIDSSIDNNYDFNINREYDYVKIFLVAGFGALALLGIGTLVVFVVVRRNKHM